MDKHYNGIHHITVLAGDAQRNATFYVKKLGMRLVKKSVNQDDPGTYHLFYGNAKGSPGSGLTFFPWPMAKQGKPGMGEAVKVALAIAENSLDYWAQHLAEEGINFEGPYDRFGQQAISFKDPDGLQLELVCDKEAAQLQAWNGSVPEEFGIRGFRGTSLLLKEAESTAEILKEVFGFKQSNSNGNKYHFTTDAPIGGSVIIEEREQTSVSANGRGIVHHVAFRASDEDDLAKKRSQVMEMGLHPTEFIDRFWFMSVYFRTPGGVLFEIATDGPGYTADEDKDKLGEKLVLPPWLEAQRAEIENRLPEVTV